MPSNSNNSNHLDTLQQLEDQLRRNDPDLTMESLAMGSGAVQEAESHQPTTDHQSSTTMKENPSTPFVFVPLSMGGGGRTHQVSEASKHLIEEEVTLEDLQHMTELFYEKAFADSTLDQFIRSHGDPHAGRFAKWIHQKLSGSSVWDQDRRARSKQPVELAEGIRHVVHDRSSAHAAAWYSPKRPARDVGRHFTLEECRVWMRLHFWALRNGGIMTKSPSFADYYVRFIAHFLCACTKTRRRPMRVMRCAGRKFHKTWKPTLPMDVKCWMFWAFPKRKPRRRSPRRNSSI